MVLVGVILNGLEFGQGRVSVVGNIVWIFVLMRALYEESAKAGHN